jgi:hypothetical protein
METGATGRRRHRERQLKVVFVSIRDYFTDAVTPCRSSIGNDGTPWFGDASAPRSLSSSPHK